MKFRPEHIFAGGSALSASASYVGYTHYWDAKLAVAEIWRTPRPEDVDPYQHLSNLIARSQEHQTEWVIGGTAMVSMGMMSLVLAAMAVSFYAARKQRN